MLKRKRNNILDSLDRYSEGVPRETFAYDDLDASNVVGWAPVVLTKEFAAERREFEMLQFTILREFYHRVSGRTRIMHVIESTEATVDQLGPWSGSVKRRRSAWTTMVSFDIDCPTTSELGVGWENHTRPYGHQ